MNKYICTGFMLLYLFIFGCNTQQVPKSQISATEERVEILIKNVGLNIYKFEYDRHKYICFYGFHEGSIVHDPDCKCVGLK